MNKNDYNCLLGKNIDNIKINNIKPKRIDKSSYILHFENPIKYHDNYVYFIFLTVNINNVIISVHISLVNLIDKSFFNDFKLQYGEPKKILITDRIITESEPVKGSFGSIITERVYDLKEGNFEEEPLLMFWKKDDFEIEISMKYTKNQTVILFKKPGI